MEPLKDPYQDRRLKNRTPPPHKRLDSSLFWLASGKPDWKVVGKHLYLEGRVHKSDFIKLIHMASDLFRHEPNIVQMNDPLTIVGDIHGQYYDLIKVLETGGNVAKNQYLFLGDYVDRGQFSIECLLLLYCIKVFSSYMQASFPSTVVLTRGNHECRQLTAYFNFKLECLTKFDQEVYDLIMDSFDLMPLGAHINSNFLALHGGLSPELNSIADLNTINRVMEPPQKGFLLDILWSDPTENVKGKQEIPFKPNTARGCSFLFGQEAFQNLQRNSGVLSVIRAHQAQLQGYKMYYWSENMFPSVITIFSAPNYCDKYNNKAAIIIIVKNSLNFKQFDYTPHPFVHPQFIDIFKWSVPFVSCKISEMLCQILKNANEENSSDSDEEDKEFNEIMQKINIFRNKRDEKKKKRLKIRQKIQFIGKMMLIKKALQENTQDVIRMKMLCPAHKMPPDLMLTNEFKIGDALEEFNRIRKEDLENERLPLAINKSWSSASQGLSFSPEQ